MYIGFYSYSRQFNNNKLFDDVYLDHADAIYSFYLVSQYLQQKGHKASTLDTEENLANYDEIVFLEFPTFGNEYFKRLLDMKFDDLYLILFEHELNRPQNKVENHKYFKKIGTWHDDFIDDVKYFKINYAHRIPKPVNFDLSRKEKLCTMINSYKLSNAPLELYSERINAIQWFEQNYPKDFDLYGYGWDSRKYSLYRGVVPLKKEILQKYKFSICYENVKDIPGYITEKILDSFEAGCVPIYLGAPNIAQHIPAKAFIDKKNFKTYDVLYKYLRDMPETEYIDYLDAIKDFFESDKSYPFSPEYLCDVVVKRMLNL
jgi:hypothetical protein